jgi:hypothetical protein
MQSFKRRKPSKAYRSLSPEGNNLWITGVTFFHNVQREAVFQFHAGGTENGTH